MALTRRLLGKTGLSVHPVGFGCYRIADGIAVHESALRRALAQGCNLIDTSTNYGDGESEVLVGRVVRDVIAQGERNREDLVVVSKIGYVQGRNQAIVRERKRAGQPYPDVVEYSPDCWHCISPEFISDQLGLSLGRLGLERLDVLLLHNPEYFLKAGGDHSEYYRRIRAAFIRLEEEAVRGRISWYGISSNSFPAPKDDDEFTSLEAVLEIATEIGAKRFGVIQFPMNLYEPGAALEPNCRAGSLLKLARESGLGTLVNRPLNAFSRNRLIRLADYPVHARSDAKALVTAVRESLARTIEWEATLPAEHHERATQVGWAHVLSKNLDRIRELDFWKQVLTHQIEPALESVWPELPRDWALRHRALCAELFAAIRALLESQAHVAAHPIRTRLESIAPALASSPTLSRQALRTYLGLEGVDCVLLGMREVGYVDDAMGLELPLPPDAALRVMENTARVD